jgi:hypothetical protein
LAELRARKDCIMKTKLIVALLVFIVTASQELYPAALSQAL